MPVIVGVDPGLHGALALYDTDSNALLDVRDMPVFNVVINKKQRRRLDHVGLMEFFDYAVHVWDARLVVLEDVGGRPGEAASGAFVFGWTACAVYMSAIERKVPVEMVRPDVWKKLMKVPGKPRQKKGAPKRTSAENRKLDKEIIAHIIRRADEMFPASSHEWRGPKGGLLHDRAEAALMAAFGAKHVLQLLGAEKPASTEECIMYGGPSQ